eukprot:14482-Heterococcus_DN1.PRE.4
MSTTMPSAAPVQYNAGAGPADMHSEGTCKCSNSVSAIAARSARGQAILSHTKTLLSFGLHCMYSAYVLLKNGNSRSTHACRESVRGMPARGERTVRRGWLSPLNPHLTQALPRSMTAQGLLDWWLIFANEPMLEHTTTWILPSTNHTMASHMAYLCVCAVAP